MFHTIILPSILFFGSITIIAPMLGYYIARLYDTQIIHDKRPSIFKPQNWLNYFYSLACFNLICIVTTFAILYWQEYLPYANANTSKLSFPAALNASISFATGTFWQSSAPENMSLFSQIFALTVQNFLSAGTGITVFIVFTRGILNNKNSAIGNFYQDFTKAILYILLPLSCIAAIILIKFGTPHFIQPEPIAYIDLANNHQTLNIGPVAGQTAIKHLVANGGSFFASASAHPFEAPTRTAVMFNLFLIMLLPVSLIFTYGFLVRAISLSLTLYAIVIIIVLISLMVMYLGETTYGLPLILGNVQLTDDFNYTGKELIYDKYPSLMWVLSITMSSSGSPNACLENYSPLSTLVLFSNLIVSKFVIEGIGSGFFAMLAYLIVAVFLRGLITGQTANFFGKRITVREINYVIVVFLIIPIGILLFTGITLLSPYLDDIITHHGSQAITDIAYNFASCFANNGSAFSGIKIDNNFFDYMTALAMFIGRYPIIYLSLAISGSLASKARLASQICQHTHSSIELGIFLLITVLLVGAIMFLPLMILGPLLEYISG